MSKDQMRKCLEVGLEPGPAAGPEAEALWEEFRKLSKEHANALVRIREMRTLLRAQQHILKEYATLSEIRGTHVEVLIKNLDRITNREDKNS